MAEKIIEQLDEIEAKRLIKQMWHPLWEASIERIELADGICYRLTYVLVPKKVEWVVSADRATRQSWEKYHDGSWRNTYIFHFVGQGRDIVAEGLERKWKEQNDG